MCSTFPKPNPAFSPLRNQVLLLPKPNQIATLSQHNHIFIKNVNHVFGENIINMFRNGIYNVKKDFVAGRLCVLEMDAKHL